MFSGLTELNYCLLIGNNPARTDVRGRDLDGNRSSITGRNLIGTAGSSPYGAWAAGSVLEGNNTQNLDLAGVINPVLAPNGGTVPTHALVAGSFAVNPAPRDGFSSPFDQRGFSRSGPVDIGSFEDQFRTRNRYEKAGLLSGKLMPCLLLHSTGMCLRKGSLIVKP